MVAAVLWGTIGTASSLAPEVASPLSIGAARLAIGGAVLAGVGSRFIPRSLLQRPALFVAAAGMAAYQPLFFTGVDRTGVAIGTAIAIGSAPFLTGGIASLLGSRPSTRWLTATAIGGAGLAILLLTSASEPSLDLTGALLCLGSGLAYAVYAVSTERLTDAGRPVAIAAATFSIAAVVLLPVLLSGDRGWLGEFSGWAAALWLGVMATALAYIFYTQGLTDSGSHAIGAPTAATLSLGEPLTAALLGVVLLTERPPALAWVGAALLLVGLVIAARDRQPS